MKKHTNEIVKKSLAVFVTLLLVLSLAACSGRTAETAEESDGTAEGSSETVREALTRADIEISDTIGNSGDGEHAIEVSEGQASYSNTEVIKTGDAEGDEADFYGANSAVFATDGATLDLSDMVITTDGTHANAVFSYGEGTVVNVTHSVIETSGNCSGGLMTTGGGTMNASDLTIHTTGNSSAAIRSDRGGGTVTVTGGNYTTDGTGSPVIYSTADITVNDADLTSTASQGVVVEGKNSVTLNNVTLTADNNTKNSDKSDWYQAVMIYQSMSGDAAVGQSSFTMNGGTLTNKNGDIFFVNNTVTEISLNGAEIVNEDPEGVFLRAQAAGWGNSGSNGGQVTLRAENQEISGDLIVDEDSTLNLYLGSGSTLTGAVTGPEDASDGDGSAGGVYVELTDGATWTLTGDSYITSLTCDADSIDLNGHALYVNGEEYKTGTASSGTAVEVPESTSSGGGMPDGAPPSEGMAPPDGAGGQPPEKPDGNGGPGGTPPDGAPGDGSAPPDKPE